MLSLEKGLVVYHDCSIYPNPGNVARFLGHYASGDVAYGSAVTMITNPRTGKPNIVVGTGDTNKKSLFTSPVSSSAMGAAHSIFCKFGITSTGSTYIYGILDHIQLIYNYTASIIEFYCTADDVTGGSPRTGSEMALARDGVPHSAVYSYDGAIQRGWVDGRLLVERAVTYNITGNYSAGCINGSGGASDQFTGDVQACGIWNRALNVDEVQTLHRDPSWWQPRPTTKKFYYVAAVTPTVKPMYAYMQQ